MEKEPRLKVESLLQGLLSLYPSKEQETIFMLTVSDIGSWVVKFRRAKIIYNRRDIICQDNLEIDSELFFKRIDALSNVMQKISTLQEEIKAGQLVYKLINPKKDSLSIFSALLNPQKSLSPTPLSLSSPAPGTPLPSDPSLTPLAHTPQTPGRLPVISGPLLKRRDYISGWKVRYFEVFAEGHMDYYTEGRVRQLRGSLSLADGKVGHLKQIYIRRGELWTFSLEIGGKIYRLASEKPGAAGRNEAKEWLKAIEGVIRQNHYRKTSSLSEFISILPSSPLPKSIPSISSLVTLPDSLPPEKRLSLRIFFTFLTLIIALISGMHYLYIIKRWISQEVYILFVCTTTFVFGLSLNTNFYQKDKESPTGSGSQDKKKRPTFSFQEESQNVQDVGEGPEETSSTLSRDANDSEKRREKVKAGSPRHVEEAKQILLSPTAPTMSTGSSVAPTPLPASGSRYRTMSLA